MLIFFKALLSFKSDLTALVTVIRYIIHKDDVLLSFCFKKGIET